MNQFPLLCKSSHLRPRVCGYLCPRGFGSLAPTYSITGERGEGGGRGGTSRGRPVIRPATGEKGGREGEGGGRGGGMITTLFHAASTTTSSHPRGQHDQSPAPQRVRGGREGEGGGSGGGGHDSDGEGGGRGGRKSKTRCGQGTNK